MRSALLVFVLATAAACTPAQQRDVGAGVAGVGFLTTYIAVDSMAPCAGSRDPCPFESSQTSAEDGVPLALVGLGVMVVGGAISATAGDQGKRSLPRRSEPPPPEPVSLDAAGAVGMALAHVVVEGLPGEKRPPKSLSVDDTASVRVVRR